MKVIRWNQDKNKLLIRERGISFEAVLGSIDRGNLLVSAGISFKSPQYISPKLAEYV